MSTDTFTSAAHRRSHSVAPSHTYGHTTKSKSISSLPPHRTVQKLALTPSHEGASGSGSTSTSTLTRSSSLRSKATSPSRLPATHVVSYFPPFEDMGSVPDSPITPSPLVQHHFPISLADPSSSSASPASSSQRTHGHAKGRSLGSIAGYMTASLSWGLSSISCGSPPPLSPIQSPRMRYNHCESDHPDGQAVQALTRRFAPSSSKRRVLEPFTVAGELEVPDERGRSIDGVGMHKRRMKSEVEVEGIVLGLGRSGSLGGRSSTRSRRQEPSKDEDIVEALVDGTPSRTPPTQRARARPNLRLPIPSFPNWRFPLTLGPSPPTTCLSPDIPMEAFSMIIDNPCSASTSSSTLSASALSRPPLGITTGYLSPSCRSPAEEELDLIDSHLTSSLSHSPSPSPSPTTSTFSHAQPSTPPKSTEYHYQCDIKRDRTADSVQETWSPNSTAGSPPGSRLVSDRKMRSQQDLEVDMSLRLERTCSRLSEMSCETVKWQEEVTPKAIRVRGVL